VKPRWLREQEGPATWASIDRAGNLLGALTVATGDRLERVMASAAECSIEAIAALQWIERLPGVRPGDLARVLRIGPPAVTQLVGGLVSDGLVLRARDRHDKRDISLRLSELGARQARLAALARARFLGKLVKELPFVLRPRLIRIAERLLAMLTDAPGTGFRTCRHCHWALCREDPAAPCPVALDLARRKGSTRTLYDPDAPLAYSDRRIVTGTEPPVELWLEPGAIAFRLDSRRRLEVVCRSPVRGRMDFERLEEGHITLYAWDHATFTVLEQGREIFVQERPLSLSMAEGDTPRKRVEFIFGDFERRRVMQPNRWL
jgi:DNA-binding MarR family transcriptional regulator